MKIVAVVVTSVLSSDPVARDTAAIDTLSTSDTLRLLSGIRHPSPSACAHSYVVASARGSRATLPASVRVPRLPLLRRRGVAALAAPVGHACAWPPTGAGAGRCICISSDASSHLHNPRKPWFRHYLIDFWAAPAAGAGRRRRWQRRAPEPLAAVARPAADGAAPPAASSGLCRSRRWRRRP